MELSWDMGARPVFPGGDDPEGFMDLAKIYGELVKDQEPLGREFEEIWDSNIDRLYEEYEGS